MNWNGENSASIELWRWMQWASLAGAGRVCCLVHLKVCAHPVMSVAAVVGGSSQKPGGITRCCLLSIPDDSLNQLWPCLVEQWGLRGKGTQWPLCKMRRRQQKCRDGGKRWAYALLLTGQAAPGRALRHASAWESIQSRLALDETRLPWKGGLALALGVEAVSPRPVLVCCKSSGSFGSWFWWGCCCKPGGRAGVGTWHGLDCLINPWRCSPPGSSQRSPELAWTLCMSVAWAQASQVGTMCKGDALGERTAEERTFSLTLPVVLFAPSMNKISRGTQGIASPLRYCPCPTWDNSTWVMPRGWRPPHATADFFSC